MTTQITSKGQVTVPKLIRDSLGLHPGSGVEFSVNVAGEVVLTKAGPKQKVSSKDRFEAVRGTATVRWRTDQLMKLLRG
jgi:AbrB family looped-hinge helix DNA binding protein